MNKQNSTDPAVHRIGRFIRTQWDKIYPGEIAWRGAAAGFMIVQIIIMAAISATVFQKIGWWAVILGFIAIELASFILAALVIYFPRLFRLVPPVYRWAAAATILLLIFGVFLLMSVLVGMIAIITGLVISMSLLGAGIAVFTSQSWQRINRRQKIIAIAGLITGAVGLISVGYFVLDDGSPANPPVNALAQVESPLPEIEESDPSLPGPYPVRYLTYGSGTDIRRPEYRDEVTITTDNVDGSLLLDGWSGLRTRYWGFGPDELPVNGRVWYPDTDGNFPLLLIVHGNHMMEDYSDSGYAYLGELLASRGYIVVSVDENFLNFSIGADIFLLKGLKEENDARGWLLLEHLEAWDEFNNAPDNPFYGRVDLNRIALAGHSRGGEAIAVAAAFNRLSHYPDNAALKFDYDFNIRSIIAIAPVDGQYLPADTAAPLENISYFIIHGAHDMDVFFFNGSNAYNRVQFNDNDFHFKAGLYVYGANHGQFNTSWGRKDYFEPLMRVYNLEQLMPAEEQQKIASVYISAFLESTLKDDRRYLPMFQDPRTASDWLPDTIYLGQYQDSDTRLIADFSEDIDPGTTTVAGGRISSDHLTIWHEQKVAFKWGSGSNSAVYIGWDRDLQPGTPQFTLEVPAQDIDISEVSWLTFSLADANLNPNPDDDEYEPTPAIERHLIELSIEAVDGNGVRADIPLSWFAPLQPQIEGVLTKARWMTSPPVGVSEPVYQTYQFPLSAFQTVQPDFDPASLQSVSLVFDGTPVGVIILDNFGVRTPGE